MHGPLELFIKSAKHYKFISQKKQIWTSLKQVNLLRHQEYYKQAEVLKSIEADISTAVSKGKDCIFYHSMHEIWDYPDLLLSLRNKGFDITPEYSITWQVEDE